MVTHDKAAVTMPGTRPNGRELRGVFRRWSGDEAVDDTFAQHVDATPDTSTAELDTDPWRD